jgi:hypothetical protein
MKHIYFIFICLVLFSLASVSAEQQSLGVFKLNEKINLIQNCINSTYSNITRVIYPNSSYAINTQVVMTKNGNDYNSTFILSNKTGQYLVYGECNLDGVPTSWVYNFMVSQNGESPKGEGFDIFIYIIFIVATLGLFLTLILTTAHIATASETIFSMLLSWGFYILLMITSYLSLYQLDSFVTTLSNQFLDVTVWSNGVLPVFSLIITIFVKSTQKKRPLSVQELTGGRYV